MAPRSSITKRWLLNSFGIIVVIMVAMVIGVSAAMHSFYYNSASQYIRTRALIRMEKHISCFLMT